MNLSVLERMARDGDMSADALRYLISCRGECEWLDFKEDLHIEHDAELCDFTRDVLGIKNVGGGYIVVGVQDKTWKPIGLKAALPYDSKMLRDKVRRAANIDLDIDIVHHELQVPNSTGRFALVFVRSTRKRKKRRTPIVVNRDFCVPKPFGLRRGEIFVRRGDQTVKVQSDKELEDLLENLEAQADQDAMAISARVSPFAVEDGTYRLLEKGFDRFIGRKNIREELLNAVTQDPRIWIINVHGPGGVGKSALVAWAVYEFYQQRAFEAIVHLTAKDTMLTPRGIEVCARSLFSLEDLLDQIVVTFQEKPPQELEKKKTLALDILSAWSTLLVLDNMETVQDGRILSFVQQLPVESRAKVLMTSRQKTGGWELPFPVRELDINEVREFLTIRSSELAVAFPLDSESVLKVWNATGGLPLAIQWLLGRFRIDPRLDDILLTANQKDSPVLEFSFRNIWQVLSPDARTILAIITIFNEPPSSQQIAIATELPLERIERALGELSDVTLVTKTTQTSDGRMTYVALPITLSFARHQLASMGDFEIICRQRFQKFVEQMDLQESEILRFQSRFERFGLKGDNEKRAAILCQRGESDMFAGNEDSAELLFKQARDIAPQSAYVYAMSASFELARNRIGDALNYVGEACKRASSKTGALCYTIKARILDAQRDRNGRVAALEKALEFDREDTVVRHQYGVALSRAGRTEEAIQEFSTIIDKDSMRAVPTTQSLMALKTMIINLQRLGREEDVNRDLALVKDIIRRCPHLAGEVRHFAEYFENEKDADHE